MLTAAQIHLVQHSWKSVVPIQDAAAGIFYDRLFVLDPQLKSLFKGDFTQQGKKLMLMLNTVVSKLSTLEEIQPAIKALAVRHNGYGVDHKDYDTVGEALLFTLEQGLGPAFTPEVKQAWTEAYGALAHVMKTSS